MAAGGAGHWPAVGGWGMADGQPGGLTQESAGYGRPRSGHGARSGTLATQPGNCHSARKLPLSQETAENSHSADKGCRGGKLITPGDQAPGDTISLEHVLEY